jgi:hypothetical protein
MAIHRRDFLKLTGLGALAIGVPACHRQADRDTAASTSQRITPCGSPLA